MKKHAQRQLATYHLAGTIPNQITIIIWDDPFYKLINHPLNNDWWEVFIFGKGGRNIHHIIHILYYGLLNIIRQQLKARPVRYHFNRIKTVNSIGVVLNEKYLAGGQLTYRLFCKKSLFSRIAPDWGVDACKERYDSRLRKLSHLITVDKYYTQSTWAGSTCTLLTTINRQISRPEAWNQILMNRCCDFSF